MFARNLRCMARARKQERKKKKKKKKKKNGGIDLNWRLKRHPHDIFLMFLICT
jgi:hypothetical protein